MVRCRISNKRRTSLSRQRMFGSAYARGWNGRGAIESSLAGREIARTMDTREMTDAKANEILTSLGTARGYIEQGRSPSDSGRALSYTENNLAVILYRQALIYNSSGKTDKANEALKRAHEHIAIAKQAYDAVVEIYPTEVEVDCCEIAVNREMGKTQAEKDKKLENILGRLQDAKSVGWEYNRNFDTFAPTIGFYASWRFFHPAGAMS